MANSFEEARLESYQDFQTHARRVVQLAKAGGIPPKLFFEIGTFFNAMGSSIAQGILDIDTVDLIIGLYAEGQDEVH